MNKRSLAEWLYALEHRHTQEVRLRLYAIREVARDLHLTSLQSKVITVTGTNGKGSTVSMLEGLYLAAGYKVGAYTSPHLFRFNERIRLNQKPIEDDVLCDLLAYIDASPKAHQLTYFEMATLAALAYFKSNAPDVVILEVGVGGRLDATNLMDADVAIITTVALDHEDYLGSTLEAIGFEKAGIMRPEKPMIYADSNPPQSVLQHARLLNAPLMRLGEAYDIHIDAHGFQLKIGHERFQLPKPNIHPQSAAAALMAMHCLKASLPYAPDVWAKAMESVSIFGRLHVISGAVTKVFDVAHNPQAADYLAQKVHQMKGHGRLHAVFSGLRDKDLPGLIKPMLAYVDAWHIALLQGSRAADETQLMDAFRVAGLVNTKTICYDDPLLAYQSALSEAKACDMVLVYGSFLMVGPILCHELEGEAA